MSDLAFADDQIAKHRRGLFFLGSVLVIVGVAAIAFPILSSLAIALCIALALVAAGIAQTAHAFVARDWEGFIWSLLVGLLSVGAGALFWFNPVAGVINLTLFLAAVLMIDGVFRSVMAFQVRPMAGWFWLLLGGIVSILLGLMIWQQLPSTALVVPGLLVGINLVFSGFTFLMLTMAASSVGRMSPKLA